MVQVNIIAKARKRALAIHRSFVSGDVHLLVRAYKTFVRPVVVEHNSVIWSPTSIRDIEEIERIQRRFLTKKATRVPKSSIYTERLRRLNLRV